MKKAPKTTRTPVDLSSIKLHSTMWRGQKNALVLNPIKFFQLSRTECLMLDKEGKVWRTGSNIYRSTADDLPLVGKRVLASWGLFTKADIDASEAAQAERHALRSRMHWCEVLEQSASQLRIALTKAQLKKIEAARAETPLPPAPSATSTASPASVLPSRSPAS